MESQQKKVLLLEDDFEAMGGLKEYIEEELGWQVELTAASDLLERLGRERFDLIIVDLMIHPSGVDADENEVQNVHFAGTPWLKTGLEFLRRLRKGAFSGEAGQGTPPDVPVIVLSAVADYSVRSELEKGIAVDDYMEKPFKLEEMVERMRKSLEG